MFIAYTPGQLRFRQEVRDYFQTLMTPEVETAVLRDLADSILRDSSAPAMTLKDLEADPDDRLGTHPDRPELSTTPFGLASRSSSALAARAAS
jgi:hypothetical protein